MNKGLAFLVLFLVATGVQAQSLYVGGSAAYSTLLGEAPAFFGVQAGGLTGALELRGVLETNFSYATLGADVMYAFRFPSGRLYLGAGLDALVLLGRSGIFPAVHTVFGGEYVFDRFGVFAETRALVPLALPAPFPSLRAGANLYF